MDAFISCEVRLAWRKSEFQEWIQIDLELECNYLYQTTHFDINIMALSTLKSFPHFSECNLKRLQPSSHLCCCRVVFGCDSRRILMRCFAVLLLSASLHRDPDKSDFHRHHKIHILNMQHLIKWHFKYYFTYSIVPVVSFPWPPLFLFSNKDSCLLAEKPVVPHAILQFGSAWKSVAVPMDHQRTIWRFHFILF